jgi:hypothetical protein
MEYLRWGESR